MSSVTISSRSMHISVRLTLAPKDLSEKNPLEVLPHDATIISLLRVFSKGTHRGAHGTACATLISVS